MGRLKLIDLFCGVGGFSYAFESTKKVKTVFANDIEPTCKRTFDLNHKVKMTVGDVKDLVDEIPEADIICAGFPCQPFSIAGKQQGFQDDRSTVFHTLVDVINRIKPKAILLENVKNLLTHDEGRSMEFVLSQLRESGYYVKYRVLNSYKHGGIPQNRERVFIVGFRDIALYKRYHFPREKNLGVSIHDLYEGSDTIDKKYYYTDRVKLWNKIRETITDRSSIYQYRRVYIRKNQRGLCPTLTANMGGGGHNVPLILDDHGVRKLTPRECFNFQGYPKTFALPRIADSSLYKQAGNSITMPLVKRLAKRIVRILSPG